jgi:hypothetical protein
MTPSEAKAAYENAVRSPELLPGSYREVSTRQTPRGATLTTTISTLRQAGGQVWTRRESTTIPPGDTTPRLVFLGVTTPEGDWRVFPTLATAIFIPRWKPVPKPENPSLPTAETTPPSGARSAATPPAKSDLMARRAEIDTHRTWSGERVQEGDKRLIRVTSVLTDKGVELSKAFAKDAIAAERDNMPWTARAAISAALPLVLATHLPVRTEYVIDADTNLLLTTREYSRNGQLFHEDKSNAPRVLLPGNGPIERVPDWPTETFELPADYAQIRAASREEGFALVNDYLQKVRAARIAAGAAPPSAANAASPEQKTSGEAAGSPAPAP